MAPITRRLTALALSWVLPATGVWAVNPPRLQAAGSAAVAAESPSPSSPSRDATAMPNPRTPSVGQAVAPVVAARRSDSTAGGADAASCNKAVRPILECVQDLGNARYRAFFGYNSENPAAVTIPIGSKNKFTPSPQGRGQPTAFDPGRTPSFPNAAFFVDFPGSNLVWTLKGLDNSTRTATASSSSARCAMPACETTFFGPNRYTRTTGPPNVFTETVVVPDAVASPFLLRIVNGEADGSYRVSSARIKVNGVEIASPSDFNQNVTGLERLVALTRPTTTLEVTLQSAPDSYLTINFCGAGPAPPADQTAPTLAFSAPPAWTGDSTPAAVIDYQDPAGAVPPSGLSLATFAATVDGEERTALFTKGPAQATAELAPALADGPHTLVASIQDVAGNQGSATHSFTVDTEPPVVTIATPAAGAYTKLAAQAVTGTVADLDPQLTVECRRGSDTVAASLASGSFTCTLPLVEGENTLEVVARDRLGHEGTASRIVHLDTTPPQVTILQPLDGDAFKAGPIAVNGGVVDASPFTVTVNGVSATVSGAEFAAGGVPLGAGPTTVVAAVATDAAGNESQASVTVRIDTLPPVVAITSPVADAYLKGPQVTVTGTVTDDGEVSVEVNGQAADVTGSSFSAQVTSPDGALTLTATARDAAGNEATASVPVTVDGTPPVIAVSAPAPGLITKDTTVVLQGTVQDASPVMLRLDGAPVALSGGGFSITAPLPGEGDNTFALEAEDAATNRSQADVSVFVDRTPPVLHIAAPTEGAVLGGLPVAVQGTVVDATETTVTVNGVPAERTGDAWQAAVSGMGEGSQTFTVVAVDAATNQSQQARTITLDLLPPLVSIESPAAGLLTREPSVAVLGTAQDLTLQGVTVNGTPASLSPNGSGSSFGATVALGDGDNAIVAVGRDALGRTGSAQVTVTRDSVAPVVDVLAPEGVAKGRTATVTVTATDNLAVEQVALKVNGTVVATAPGNALVHELTVPEAASPGDTLVLRGEAVDIAGNEAAFQRALKVLGSGAVVGQVLDDRTGLPLPQATARMLPGTQTAETDERGRYSLPTTEAQALVVAEKAGMTSAEREVGVALGVGTVPPDARLTALALPVTLGPDGGTVPWAPAAVASAVHLPSASMSLGVPPGALSSATEIRLTPLTPQGLPGLLPLGWSPLLAFDLRASSPLALPLEAQATGLSDSEVHLVLYDLTSHAFTVVAGPLTPVSGGLALSLPSGGAFVLVAADAGEPVVPAPVAGQPLLGVAMAVLGPTVTSEGTVTPKTLPPTGGTAEGALAVQSPVPLPSGTVVQAEVVETYALAEGGEASSEPRSQDILLFRTHCPGTSPNATATPEAGVLCAQIPITPSRSYRTEELTEGRVHLDILAGREGVRGTTGGSEALTLTSGGVVLTVPGLSLTKDTALSVEATSFSSFLPQGGGLEALQELTVDFSGQTLGLSAALSVEGTTAVAGDTLVLARVVRVQGVPRLAVVALAGVDANGKVATVPHPDLPGVTQEGRYVFYRLGTPVGIVKGTATAGGSSLVVDAVGGLPFIGVVTGAGSGSSFVLVTLTGTVTVKGSVPGTSLKGQATTSVVPPESATVVLVLGGTVSTATVAPEDGATNLPLNTQVTITSVTPLLPASVTTDSLKLRKVVGGVPEATPVPVKVLLSGSGKSVALIPQSPPPPNPEDLQTPPLEFSTQYRLDATTLSDVFGGAVAVPETAFTTKDDVPPVYDFSKLKFLLEDGTITVSAPPGTFPLGTDILIINTVTGEVLSFHVDNDGGVGGLFAHTLKGSADHTLLVTITDALGGSVSFSRSQFVTPDGKTLIGPGGGVVTGEGGVELRIPEGALEKGVELKLKGLTVAELEAKFPGQAPGFGTDASGNPVAKLGSGIEITSEQKPNLKKPIDLAFPVPAEAIAAAQAAGKDETAPYFYVVKRLEGPCANGAATCAPEERSVAYQTIDHAFVQCPEGKATCAADEKKVVTASWPFSGYMDFSAGFAASPGSGFLLQAASVTYNYLMWTFNDLLPGKSLAGVITGKVQRTEWNPGALTPKYLPVKGAYVSGVDSGGTRLLSGDESRPNVAISREDGTFTLWDTAFTGGTVTVAATLQGGAPEATCPTETDTVVCATGYEANPQDWKSSGLRFHQSIATVNLTFPAQEPPPAPPAIAVTVYKLVGNERQLAGGIVPVDTRLVVGITPTEGIEIRDATVQGEPQNLLADPLKGKATGHDFIVETTPTQVGTYRVKVLGLNFLSEAIEGGTTFRAIGAGGPEETVEGQAPRVLEPDTRPKDKAKGVPVQSFMFVRFSEPVKKVYGNVTLKDAANQVIGARISGALKGGGTIEDLSTSPDAVVTSLTIQPLQGLQYTTTYTLELGDGIQDLDTVPQNLVPYATSFETFGPETLTEDPNGFGAAGMIVLQDRAYLVENAFLSGLMRVFETSDPVTPVEIPNGESDPRDPRFVTSYRPVDIAGEVDSPVGPSRLVAISTSSTGQSKPSNVWVLDVSDDSATQWIGAVSLMASAQEGFIVRTFVKSGVLYSASHKKGLQIADLTAVTNNFRRFEDDALGHFEMRRDFHTDGRGYGQGDVVNVAISGPAGGAARLEDVEAGLVRTAAAPEPRLLVTLAGDSGLTVVDPGFRNVLSNEPVSVKDAGGATLATLLAGQALAMGTLPSSGGGTQDVTVLVGTGTVGSNTGRGVLMVVSLLDPANPVGLGFVEIADRFIVDVILKDDLALLGGTTYTTVINLADPAQPRVAGVIQGIAGRLALSPDGLLFGSAYSRFGGAAVPLGGVKTAALGNVAIVEGTDPVRVVVGEGPRAAEDFKLKLRVLPQDYEVSTAKIRYQVGEQIVGAPVNVTMANGRGELPLPLGFSIPKGPAGDLARPRLVINEGTPEQLLSGPKAWNIDSFQVRFRYEEGQEEAITADLPEIEVEAVSAEWRRRFEQAEPGKEPAPKVIDWEAISAPAVTTNLNGLARDGLYETVLETGTKAGEVRLARAKLGPVVLGTTTAETIEPGLAATIDLSVSRETFPADGKTEILLTAEAKDQHGNLVSDGTAIFWETNGEGEFVETQEVTQGGKATTKYRAGSYRPQTPLFKAHVDDAMKERMLTQEFLTITVTPAKPEVSIFEPSLDLEVDVSSAAGPPVDGTPVEWSTTSGQVEVTQPLVNGKGKARWVAVAGMAYRPIIAFGASIGSQRGQVRVNWVPRRLALGPDPDLRMAAQQGARDLPGGGVFLPMLAGDSPVATVAPMVIAGDKVEDGTFTMELPDGTTKDLPYRATADYEVTGLVPGEQVEVRLGSNRNPNMPPLAYYRAEDGIELGVVTDEMGKHDGVTALGVFARTGGYRGLGFDFGGTGVITVPHDAEFEFPGAFMVQAAVKPPPGQAQTIVEKTGDYQLALIEDGGTLKARFTVTTTVGDESVTSVLPVPPGMWSLVTGRYEGGRLWIGIDSSEDFAVILGAPLHSTADIRIGDGYEGLLDEVRFTDLEAEPLSTFANGEQSISFIADASGEFRTTIVSTGRLGVEAASTAFGKAFFATMAAAEPDPEVTKEALGGYFTDTVTFFRDRGERSESSVGYVTSELLAYSFEFVAGIWGAGDGSPTSIAGDLVGGTVLGIITTPRDFINAGERAIRMQGNKWDAITIVTALIGAATVVVSKKAKLFSNVGKLTKLASRGDSAGPVARRIAKEVVEKLDDFPGRASLDNVAKIAAEGSTEAKQALKSLMDGVGGKTGSLDLIEGALARTDDQEGMIRTLGQIQNRMPREELLDFLTLVGTCAVKAAAKAPLRVAALASLGILAAVAVGPSCPPLSPKAASGLADFNSIVKAAQIAKGKTPKAMQSQLMQHLAARGKVNDVLEKVNHFAAQTPVPTGYATVLLELGRPSIGTSRGAERVLEMAYALTTPAVPGRSLKSFELPVPIAALKTPVTKQPRIRRYDLVLEESGNTVHIEVKAWEAFPPLKQGQVGGALDQMRRDFVQRLTANQPTVPLGNRLASLRWLFPDVTDAQGQAQLWNTFRDRMFDPNVNQALLDSGLNQTQINAAVAQFKSLIARGQLIFFP